MPTGPIFFRTNETAGYTPKTPSFGDLGGPSERELISNPKDGRVWIRKLFDVTAAPNNLFAYNYEQIGGPYVIENKSSGHTLTHSDSGRILFFNNTTGVTLTVPLGTGPDWVNFVKGTEIQVIRGGLGFIGITGSTGVTLNSKNGNLTISPQWGKATLIKRDTDTWVITGDLS